MLSEVRLVTLRGRRWPPPVAALARRDGIAKRNVFGDSPSHPSTRALVERYAKKLGKTVSSVPASALARLRAYHWPGNVRELENVIERALILMTGSTLDCTEMLPPHPMGDDEGNGNRRLQDVERKHIVQILDETHWKIEGREGAATRLGLKTSTLRDRLRKLGLSRPGTASWAERVTNSA